MQAPTLPPVAYSLHLMSRVYSTCVGQPTRHRQTMAVKRRQLRELRTLYCDMGMVAEVTGTVGQFHFGSREGNWWTL